MDYFISLVLASVFVGRITADASIIQTCDCPWTLDQFNSLAAEVAILRADVEELRSSMTVSSNIQLDQANEIPEPNNVVGNIVYLADEEAPNPPPQPPKIDGFVYATCKPMPNSALTQELFQPITGSVNMKQNASGGPLFIDVFMYGFSSAAGSKHGFHIHTYGDLKEGCQSTGGHYNPHNRNHGGPNDGDRHVGDLGNIVPNEHGVVTVAIEDSLASLVGEHSVIGRAIVIHAGEDDLGLGGYSDSLTTGHAGARLACCVIGTCEQ